MNVSRCLKMAKVALEKYRSVTCEACGTETLSGDAMTFCSNCEGIVNSDSKTVERSNPELSNSLGAIRSAVAKGDFAAASAAYDFLLKDKIDPRLLYAKGLMFMAYSNYTVSQINYEGEGFMEHNSQLRDNASLQVSEAKKLIAKSLAISEREVKDAPSANAFYRMLLCDLKMGNLRAASYHLGSIEKIEKDGQLPIYGRLALETYAGDYKAADKSLERVFKLASPPANALYYAAFNAFRMGDSKSAEQILKSCGNLVENSKKAFLMEAIKQAASL